MDMSEKERFILTFSGVFCSVGLILVAVAVGILISQRKKRKKCTQRAVGTVTDMVLKSASNPRYSSWHPEIEFTAADGRMIRKVYSFGSDKKSFSVGQQVEIMYDPHDPGYFYLPQSKAAKIIAAIFIPIGILFTCTGFVVGILVNIYWI